MPIVCLKMRFFYIVMGRCKMYLAEWEMSPRIYMARLYDTVQAGVCRPTAERKLESYEIGYYLTDGGEICINGNLYPIQKGAMRFMRPGDKVKSIPPYRCYTVFFHMGKGELYQNEFLDGIFEFFRGSRQQEDMMKKIVDLFHSQTPGDTAMQIALLLELLYQCYHIVHPRRGYSRPVEACITYMQEHLKENITLKSLGKFTGYTPLHVRRLFEKDVMSSPHEYLRRLRMAKARKLLAETNLPISRIAVECGYSSESHFQMLFKEVNDCSPGTYRRTAKIIP